MPENKKQIIMMVIAAVVIIISVVSAVLLYRGISELNKAGRKLNSSLQTLRSFYEADPFPSTENIEVEKDNLKTIRHWHQEINRTLAKGQITPDNKSPSTFMSLLGEVKGGLVEDAKKSGTGLPNQFSFGFDRYFAAGSALPDPANVGRLTQQLRIIEKLCKNLYDSHVFSIITIKREEFESPPSSSRETGSRGRRRGNIAEEGIGQMYTGGDSYNPDVGLLKQGDLFAKFHFVFEFSAKEQSLLDFLNKLAAEDMHVIVTTLRVEKTAPDVLLELPAEKKEKEEKKEMKPATPSRKRTTVNASGGEEAVVAPVVETKEEKEQKAREFLKSLSRKERMVSGLGLEKPMKIRLEVDVYNFPVN